MLIAHAVKQSLPVLGVIDYLQRQILVGHLLQGLGNLIHVALVPGFVAHTGVGCGYFHPAVFHGRRLCSKAVSRLRVTQLRQRADISRMKLGHFHWLIALKHIELADLLFHFRIYVIKQIVCLQHAGIHLDQ